MDLKAVQTALWYANIAGSAFLCMVLLRNGLVRVYPFLFTYLAIDTAQQVIGVWAVQVSDRYTYFLIYVAGTTIKKIVSVLVVLELCRHVLAKHPALRAFARRTAVTVTLAAATLALAGLRVVPPNIREGGGWRLPYFLAFERTMDLTLLFLLAVLSAFLLWFPVRLSRNAAYYIAGFFAYALARWLGIAAIGAFPEVRTEVDAGLLTFSFGCLIGMAYLMRRAGETETVVPGHSWNPEAMERLSGQLDSLNASLSRAAHR